MTELAQKFGRLTFIGDITKSKGLYKCDCGNTKIVKAKYLMDQGYITKVKIKGVLLYHNDFEFADQLEVVAARDKKSCYDLECEKIQESDNRLMVINKIVKDAKQNTLVLFHNTEYGQKIFNLLKEENSDKEFYYIDGSVKNNGTKKNVENNRTYIKQQMEKTDKVRVLVASFGTLSTGVSINAIANVIFTQSFKKDQVIIQSIGRALRLHAEKAMAYIFDLVDIFNQDPDLTYKKGKYKFRNILHGHWEKRLHIYAKEEYPVTQIEINL
jgi:superfamily II DNA or RNA helicase